MIPTWTISPGIGIGPLHLGMTRADVETLANTLGPVAHYYANKSDPAGRTYMEERNEGMPICVYTDDCLVRIDMDHFTDAIDVRYADLAVFTEPTDVICRAFVAADPDAVWAERKILFPNLAVTMWGFLIHAIEGKDLVFAETAEGFQSRKITLHPPGALDDDARGWPLLSDRL